jgi:GNAT superfamily N-acetyltransferase
VRDELVRFLRSVAVRTAGRVERLPWGVALFADGLPDVWDLNVVWVDAVPPGLSADALAAGIERVQGAAGLSHRQAVLPDEAGGARLAPRISSLGWSVKRHLLMVHRRPPDRLADLTCVREAGEPVIRALTEASLRQDSSGLSEDTIRQLGATKGLAAAAGARFFVADAGGVAASGCDLYTDGRVAQIEAVLTLDEHRNRGLASAVVLEAVAEARAGGHDLVFLQAEEDDWPKLLYGRLGFDPVGCTYVFLRHPAERAAVSPPGPRAAGRPS